jgi:hypothetical protein
MTDSLTAPSSNCFPITTSDTVELPTVTKAVYVGTGGDVALRSVRGAQDVIFRNISSGAILDVRASHVRTTGTTAANLVGLA